MSFLSRLRGKSRPAPATPAAKEPAPAVEPKPRPDHAARAREEEALVSQAIAAGDLSAVGKWVIEGSSTAIRQKAAHAITDLEQLRELLRATRGGNDKNVHRILADKRDQLLAAIRREEQLHADLESTAAAIAAHGARAYDALYEATLRQLETKWQSLAAQAAPEMQREVAEQLDRAREVVRQHREAVAAEGERKRSAALAAESARRERELEAETTAAAAAEHARLLEAERQAAIAKRQADHAEVRHILGLLRQAQAALDDGGTARAARLRDTIKDKLPQAPALPPWFSRKLEELDARIEEMKDWKTFTVVPKRAGLIERMQSLVGADMSPEELARQVRRLRDEWRTLNRGASEDPSPEWQEFDAAATRAYEPCREYFARQAELRRENHVRREALLERLATFVAEQSGELFDGRVVQRTLAEARREWREYAPVEQSAVKPLQERFHALTDDLQKRLDAEYDRNVATKRELIARMAELATLEDARAATAEAKSLQRTWKTVGLVPRHQDNALWEEFRKQCDAVFERSSKEAAAAAAARDADRRASEARRLEREEAAHRGWTDLLAAAAQVRAWALATVQQRSADECETLRAAAAAAVAGLEHAPKGTRAILEQQLAQIAAGEAGTDLAANETALRLLCIRAELIADLATPPEDLELRREYQMQRLVASMGRGERSASTDLNDLVLEWIAAGPVEPALHDQLFARFERCREHRRR